MFHLHTRGYYVYKRYRTFRQEWLGPHFLIQQDSSKINVWHILTGTLTFIEEADENGCGGKFSSGSSIKCTTDTKRGGNMCA